MNPASVTRLEKTLSIIAATLIVLIFIGTIIGVSKKSINSKNKENSSKGELVSSGTAGSLFAPVQNDTIAYFELGQIRVVTLADDKKKNDKGTVLVVAPWLSYEKNDNIFYEELARKRGVIKGMISSYFSGKTKKDLKLKSEEVIQAELLGQINAQLNLGKIKAVNFTDYMFFE